MDHEEGRLEILAAHINLKEDVKNFQVQVSIEIDVIVSKELSAK